MRVNTTATATPASTDAIDRDVVRIDTHPLGPDHMIGPENDFATGHRPGHA
ncbi:hypothetical protein BTZ20_0980 [Rhodococcus sp. MTM3W5.2]|nr:hypothetical protein BTZ20_0980 [Rhodococcus sp. MTM3W5.2]